VSKGHWAFGILECPYLIWKPTQIVIMLEQILTGNPQQEVVNFLAEVSLLGNAKSKPLWPLLLQKPNMLLLNMAALESCPKHNMIAYLEKTEGNVEFHEVIDFLQRS
ncbi:hypothetical protein Tco_0230026, partial [Tanacetum coccineum]